MDSENQPAPPDAEQRRATLAHLAEYLLSRQESVTEQWSVAVRRDPQIDSSDRLTHRQLVDRLPHLYRECCEFLVRRDAGILAGATRSDAREHGGVRWQDGYQIDEVLRELEAFRRIIASAVTRHGDLHPHSRGEIEKSAQALIHQFFSEVTIQSVGQFVQEQKNVVADYTQKLESSNLELGRTNASLQRALSERQRLTKVVAHELRNFLQGLGYARQVWDRSPGATRDQQQAREQIEEMEKLLAQLLQHSELIASDVPLQIAEFDPGELQEEIVREYADSARRKGLQFIFRKEAVPARMRSDRAKVKQLVVNLLSNAIRFTTSGEVGLTVARSDADRLLIGVSDSGPGLPEEAAERLFGFGGGVQEEGIPARCAGLAMAKDVVHMLGGSVQVITQAGNGTRLEVFLPLNVEENTEGV